MCSKGKVLPTQPFPGRARRCRDLLCRRCQVLRRSLLPWKWVLRSGGLLLNPWPWRRRPQHRLHGGMWPALRRILSITVWGCEHGSTGCKGAWKTLAAQFLSVISSQFCLQRSQTLGRQSLVGCLVLLGPYGGMLPMNYPDDMAKALTAACFSVSTVSTPPDSS